MDNPFDVSLVTIRGRKRALLDTNIWRYVVDANAQGPFLKLAREGAYDIQIAPAVLFETLRLRDTSRRDALIRLMTNKRFHRLMPEAYSEGMEVLREIARICPDWLRPRPNLHFFNRLHKDWSRRTGGLWVRCERSPETEASYLDRLGAHLLEATQHQADRARQEMRDAGWKKNPSMNKTLAGFTHPVAGWRGDMVDAWRIDSYASLTFALGCIGNGYRDWVAPFVDLDGGLLESEEWVEFWLYLTKVDNLPRQWMRWAHAFAQRFRKVTSGSPGDTQLSTYFLETDVIITADKIMLAILEECRPFAPCSLPDGRLVPAGRDGVASLFQTLSK